MFFNDEPTHKLWTFKYEPTVLSEYIGSEEMKETLQKVIDESPNILLSGPPGVGKGTFVNIYLRETGYDFIKINASMENNIDMVRNKINSFALSLGTTKYKIVYLNEMDYLSPAAQAGLRQLIEDVHEHTRFVMTCNYINKVPAEILSRCQHIEMGKIPAAEILKHCEYILKNENVEIENIQTFKRSLVNTIKTLYPDVRRIINSLEKSVINGKISEINVHSTHELYENILSSMLERDIDSVREILRKNAIEYVSLYQYIFENVDKFKSPGDAIIKIGEYLYRDNFIAIKEINFLTMVVSLIKDGSL